MTVLYECCYCGRQSTPGLFVAIGTSRYRCKSSDSCQRRIRRNGNVNVGDRVRLIDPPAGWSQVTGTVTSRRAVQGRVIVEWSNGESCYERRDRLAAE